MKCWNHNNEKRLEQEEKFYAMFIKDVRDVQMKQHKILFLMFDRAGAYKIEYIDKNGEVTNLSKSARYEK